MHRRPATLSALVAVTLVIGFTQALVTAQTSEAATRVSAIKLLNLLPVKKETHASSYDRGDFKLWIDRDGDCQDTRAKVLIAESRTATTGDCTIKTGSWVSAYDGKKFTVASKLDIDHLVPLSEAWHSGAWKWSAKKREAFANDLGDPRDLIAVSASTSTNRSKGDDDPAEWLPAKDKCTYVENWVPVKFR